MPVDERQRLREPELGDLSRRQLVLTAGTTVTGAVDPLAAGLGDAAWRHVDAAWAGRAAAERAPCRAARRDRRRGFRCDLGPKWLFQPRSRHSFCSQDAERAHSALSFGGSYLALPNVGLLGSHGAAALPLAATLLAWGRVGMTARIDFCMAIAERPADAVAGHERLELFSGPETGVVVCARQASPTCRPARAPAGCVRRPPWRASSGCARWRPTRWRTRSWWWKRCCGLRRRHRLDRRDASEDLVALVDLVAGEALAALAPNSSTQNEASVEP